MVTRYLSRMFTMRCLGNATLQAIRNYWRGGIRRTASSDGAVMGPGVGDGGSKMLALVGCPIKIRFSEANYIRTELILKSLNGEELLAGS